MGLILSIFGLGLMASLSPATIVVFIVVLGTARARVNAGAFLVGWAASLTIVFAFGYLVGSSRSAQRGDGRTGLLILEALVGVALVVIGIRQWRRRHDVVDEPTAAPDDSSAARWAGRLNERRFLLE
ncbi:MAG TPA: GAP family protein, partial [Nocardioides sp.]|nr:GAP family protein [Nocardioides sp.]